MKFMKSPIALLFAALIVAAACSRYDEGGFSLRSPEARLTQKWEVEQATDEDGNDITDNFEGSSITFAHDNTFTQTFTQMNQTVTTDGTWEFEEDKTQIITEIEFDFGGVTFTETDTATILRLTGSEFWVNSSDNSEIRYMSAE